MQRRTRVLTFDVCDIQSTGRCSWSAVRSACWLLAWGRLKLSWVVRLKAVQSKRRMSCWQRDDKGLRASPSMSCCARAAAIGAWSLQATPVDSLLVAIPPCVRTGQRFLRSSSHIRPMIKSPALDSTRGMDLAARAVRWGAGPRNEHSLFLIEGQHDRDA